MNEKDLELVTNRLEQNTDAAIEAIRAKVRPEFHPDFDGVSCVDCGDTIPEGRLKLGKVRCVHCQQQVTG